MKILHKLIYPVLLAAVLLLAVRGLLVTHLRMPEDTTVRGLKPGQHVLVSLTSYGLRLPGQNWWGYHRLGYAQPAFGDRVVFDLPSVNGRMSKPLQTVGVCQALPGETVWIDPVRRKVLPARTSPDAQPIVIPGRQQMVNVTPYNVRLLAYILRQYEGREVEIDDDSYLWCDGKKWNKIRMGRDYYWLETRPDSYVLVPHDALAGKIVYSLRTKE